ncbi:MAG: hypothetical protein LBR19_04690, partial [Bifidobacteriaceae bacterium]|nr:hypothetical protein [Bifidobacteriaceae bacterium]
RALRRHRAEAVADGAIGLVRECFGRAEAARLLDACSVAVAAGHLPDLIHLMGRDAQPSLVGLARRAPELVAGAIAEYLRPWPDYWRQDLVAEFSQVLEELAALRPDLVFGVIGQRLSPALSPLVIRHLAKADAARTAALLAVASEKSRFFLLTAATARQLVLGGAAGLLAPALWRAQHGHQAWWALRRLLRAIPPGQRVAAIGADVISEVPLDNADIVALLPLAERRACARRWLERLAGAAPAKRRTWQWLLPLAAQDEAWALTRHPDPVERWTGYRMLLKSAFGERSDAVLVDLLNRFTRLTNESNPVREVVAGELAAGWRGKNVPAGARDWLGGFIEAVRDARDTSLKVVHRLFDLVKEALNQASRAEDKAGVEWALDQLDKLLAAGVGVLDPRGLSRPALDLVWPRLAGWLEHCREYLRLHQIGYLHRLRRPEIWDRTVPFLQHEATEPGRSQSAGIGDYLDDPRHRDERVAELIKLEPSVGYYYPCARVIASRRTDLLDPYLKAKPFRGHFSSKSNLFLTEPRVIQRCWLPRQQAAYRQALNERMFAGKNEPTSWSAAARLAAALTSAGPDRLVPYLEAKEVSVVEAGLAALPRAGDPDAAAVRLLEEAETDRSRVAFYALFPALARLTPQRAAELVQPFLTGGRPAKVTSLKALVHLVDGLGLPGVVPSLLTALGRAELHRDVAYATAAVLTRHLDQPAVARAVRAAAATKPSVLDAVLGASRTDLPLPGRQALAGLVVDLLVAAAAPTRHGARISYETLAEWDSRGLAVLAAQVADPTWEEWRLSAKSLGVIAGRSALDGVEELCAELAGRAEAEVAAGGVPGRVADLPSLRRLEIILGNWSASYLLPPASQAALLRVAARLGESDALTPLATETLLQAAFKAAAPHVAPALFDAAAALCPPWLAVELGLR